MGDNDGSSGAAQRARNENANLDHLTEQDGMSEKPGLFGRLMDAFTSGEAGGDGDTPAQVPATAQSHGMMNLRRMRVEDVAIPTAEIIAVPQTVTQDELVQIFRDSGLTRIPVYDGTLDTPIGFVHLKDFALTHGFNGGGAPFDLKSMLRDLLFVPPSMPIGVLLTKMQTERRHMALVIDEYGGVDGLLTIEDVIEQVVGEIDDEHDTEEGQTWHREKPGCYLALAKTPLDEFETEIGLSLTAHEEVDEEEIDSLGGLVFMLSGRVPARGEVVQHPDGPEFEVVDADPRRIKRLRVRLPHAAE
jgi:magnesium and cobalt transporter